MGKFLDYTKKKKREEEESSSSSGGGNFLKYTMEKTIGLDTFESDLADMGNTIGEIYSGWQTPETMANTKVAVESMQNRVNKYDEYKKMYGVGSNLDLDNLKSGYQTVLDDWDKLTQTYGAFKDAESYKNYPNYQKSLEEEQKKKDERVKALDNSFDQYKYYEEMDDFEERSQYKSTIENKKFLWMDDRYIGDEVYEYINNADGKIRGELLAQHDKYQANAPIYTPSKYAEMGLDYLTEEEKRVFNVIYTDSKESAYKFLDDMKTTLLRRGEEQKNKAIKESVDDNFLGSAALSIASVPMSIGGGIYSGIESITGLITGEDNPYSVYHGVANESSSIRQNVGEEIEEHTEGVIGSDVFGQNIYRFLYDTGMSMADSAMGIAGFGKAFTPIMGMNAYQQKYKEMIEGGEDQETAQSMALASGVAETLFEHLSVEKLFNIKNVDGWKKGIKAAFAQAGFEGSEELFTELANVISDDVIRGEGSDFKSQYNELVARGYSEEEAKAEIRNQFISQLGWAFAGGALSGLGMGGLDAKYQYNILTETGKDIRANDRASEMINVASDANMTAQESETYKLYTEYANNAKGDINADNISDAQLGNLYATAKNETYDTLNSKKATPQQKFDAERRVSGLAEVETKKTEAEKSRPDRLKALETGEVTEVKATGNSTSIEGFRTENGETFVQTGEGEFKTSEMTFTTKDAELLSYAEGMGDVKGNLFLSQYDGTANIDDYAKSFNLVHAYGESGFGHQNALALKGVLSERQAFEVYSNAMLNKAAKDQKVLEGVFKDGKVKIDESVIDYTNSGKGEVNWNELTPSQRKSVHVAKVYANALGVDLTFFNTKAENDVYKGKQGAYYGDGVLHVDIQAGRNTVMDHNSYIVPVMSHELTHHLERTSPKAYAKLQDHVMNTLVMHNGGTVHDLIETERSNLAGKRGVDVSEISEELAISELVARSCEDMLSNSKKAKEFLSEFTESERNTFVGKVKEMYHNLIKWIDNVLKKLDPKTNEAKAFREHKAEFEKLLELWDEALVEMKANQKNADNVVNGETLVNGISKDGTTIVGENVVQMSERTYDEGGRDYLQNWLKKKVKSKFITQEDADDILKQTDAMYDLMQDIKNEHELPDYARWAATDVTTDENGKKVSVIVKNGDYSMNLDIALVCKKRTALNAVLNAMVQSNDLSVYTLTETDVSELNAIIKKHEFEIACALCFVDSKRYRVGSWAESFCEGSETKEGKKYGFNEMVRSLVPKGSNIKIDEFNFTGRDIANQPTENLLKDADDSELDFTLIDQIMKDNPPAKNGAVTAQYRYAKAIKSNPELRSILNPSEIISSIGLDAIRVENTLLYGLINGHQGTAKPKFAHQSVAFKNDILRATSWNANKAKKVGGVRLQSFSDFMANMVFDYAQMISEMAAKKLPAHAYTKEPLFVKLFGLTGMKINMSLVPRVDITEEQKARFKTLTDAQKETDEEYNRMKETAGLRINKNGEAEYVWEDETFPYDVAMDIMADKRYTKNCGTICVGISNAHINKLLADERISMVIPYHKSGLNHMVAEMRNIALYNDYTNVQNTRYASGEKLDPKKHKDFDFYGDLYGTKSKPGTHDPKQTAENYKKWCAEHNYLPKFDYFKDNPNYYKLLIDFSVYDINDNMRYTEQEAVKPIYPSNEEFKDLIVNGVVKNGVTYGGLKQAQVNASRLNAETKEIINEFRNRLTEKYGEDVLGQAQFSDRITDEETLDFLNEQISRGEYDAETNPNGGYYVTYKSMSFWGYDDEGNAILRSPMAEYVDGKLSNAYLIPKNKGKLNWYKATETLDPNTGMPTGLLVKFKKPGNKSASYLPAIENQELIKEDWSNLFFNLKKRILKKGKLTWSDVPARYNPYEHSSNSMLNDQFSAAYERENLVTVKMYVPVSEDSESYRAKWSKDPTGWTDWKTGIVATEINKQKELKRRLYLSRYAAPVEIVPDSEVAKAYKGYIEGTDVAIPDNVVSPSLLKELRKIGVPIAESGLVQYSDRYEDAFFDLFDSDGTFAESYAIIEEDVNRLKQRLSMGASSMSLENIKMIAKHLLQKADSRYDFEELTDDIKDIFEYIRTSKDLDSNALIAKCKDVASRILADQNEEKVSRDYAKMVLREIRSEKISTSKEQLEGIKDRYGDKYNNAIIGRIPRNNNGVSLDSKWAEWSKKYPGIFDANIESKDMLTELDDIVKAMQSASDARHVFEEAVDTTSLGAEIYNQMWLRSTTDVKTDADKQRLKELNFAHRKAIDNVRNNLTNRQIDSMRMVQIIDNLKQKNKADVKKAKELGKERMDKYRDMVERKAKIEQISKTALTLNDWMRKPSNEKHIHDEMQPVVSYLLNAIDFSSKRLLNKGVETKKDISLQKALSDLQNATKDMRLSEDAIYALYGENLDEDVKKLVDSVNNTMRTVGDNHYILNQMSLEELETLCKVVKSIKHSVTQMNHFHVVNHSKGIINLGQEFINHAKKYGQIKLHKHGNDARFTLNWGNALPFFTMKRFGEAGVKVRNALMDGQDKLAFNADKIIKYAEKTYTSKECKEWSEDIKTIEILLPAKNGQPSEKKTIQIPVSHIMSLYCLSKREHALGHLSGGGIRIVDFETKNGVVSQSEGILLMGSELNKIVGKLTKRQIEVADALQKFMNEDCSDWGNEISMARFGYKAFTEKNYFPIASDKTVTGDGSVKDNEKSLYRLLNMSFAKPLTEKANNRIEVDNIFDVFAKHTSEMAKYNAMALPVLDAVRWFAYHEKGEKVDSHFKTESVRQAMEKAYGKDAVTYVRTLLEDINGADNVGRDKIAKGFMSKAKIASVGFNLKVVALQPTSYLRARAVIDGKYLIKAKTRKPKIDMAEKWCGIAKWKSFGFYDINIQRGLADLIKHDASLKDRITDASMKGAEWADKFTLGYLWNACEYEVMDKRKDLVVGSDEFNTEVGKKLREVIYSTQVVDSTMTRSHMMRSGDTKDKILTNFASEPTLSYNMVLDCVYDWSLTKRETGSNSEGFKKYGKKFARTLYAYTVTSAITAALETAFSMFRDDDEEKDEEEIIKMYLESFALNMSIMNKIPYAKELISIAQGFRSSNMETQWMQYFTYAAKEAMKVIEGEGNAYKMTKNALQGASYLSGIPAYNFIRDAKSLWNLVVGSAIPSLKLKVD